MNNRITIAAIALLAGTLVSCNVENATERFNNNGNVGVIVSGAEGAATKSGESVELIGTALLEDIDGQDLRLDMYVEDNGIMPFVEDPATKGSIVTSESINTKGQQFAFNGWLGSENRYPNDGDGRSYEEGGSTGRVNNTADATNFHFLSSTATCGDDKAWTLDPEGYWRNAVPSTFWSYYPTGTDGIGLPGNDASDEDQAEVTFAPKGVTGQQDILFAYNLHKVSYDGSGKTNDSEYVNIHFYHALAAIRFDVAGAINNSIAIKEIYFKNVVTAGECGITGGATSENSVSPGLVSFAWTPSTEEEDKATISQSIASTDFTETGLDGETANALMPLTSSKFLFFIPQAVEGAVEIGIKYTRTDGDHEISLPLAHVPWEAGKIYTYKLNPNEDVLNVEVVEESVSENVKNNVSVKNTGNLKAFFRVAVVGNWNVGDTQSAIIDGWSFDPNDTKSGAVTGFNSDWVLSTDGFYYYTKVVNPGESPTFFTKFEAPSHPNSSAHLDMHIIAQAIAAGTGSNYSTAWAAVLPTNE